MHERKERSKWVWPLAIIIFAGVLFWTAFAHLVYSHSPTGWKAPAKERKVKNPVPDNPESRSRGQKIYGDKCAVCHGGRGDGQTEMGKSLNPPPPDLTDRHMMKEMTDGEIFWKVTTGKGPMPSYKKELTEKERWDLVNYIKSLARPE